MRWIFAADGSALQVANITRLFVDTDVTASQERKFVVKASTLGCAMPFVISRHESLENASERLKDLVVGRERRGY